MDFVRFFIQDLGEDHTDCVIHLFFRLFLFLFRLSSEASWGQEGAVLATVCK